MMLRTLAAALAFFALSVVALLVTHTSAWAAADPATFRLTPALLDRMEAATAEAAKLPQPKKKAGDDEDDGEDAESIEDLARKLDADPRVRAILKRHGISATEYATATFAALHAGMALAVEKAPGAAKQAQNFTPAQRANVEVMRARQKK